MVFMSLLLLVELKKNSLPLGIWNTNYGTIRFCSKNSFQTFVVNLRRKIEKQFWSKTECSIICVSNAKVGESFFFIPQTKAETSRPSTLPKTLRSDFVWLVPFYFFRFCCFTIVNLWVFEEKISRKSLRHSFRARYQKIFGLY